MRLCIVLMYLFCYLADFILRAYSELAFLAMLKCLHWWISYIVLVNDFVLRAQWTKISCYTEYLLEHPYYLNIYIYFGTGIFLLTECIVLEYFHSRNIVRCNIPTDWILILEYPCCLNILYWNAPTDWIYCSGIFLLTKYFLLQCSHCLNICTGISLMTEYVLLEYISLLTEYIVLKYSYWLNILYWNIRTSWIFCTGIPVLTEY